VVTGAGVDDATITGGTVLVRDGRIEEVGAWDALRVAHPDAEVLGSDDVAVLPGHMSAHHHAAGVSHLQQGVADDVLEPWLLVLRAQAQDVRTVLIDGEVVLRDGLPTRFDLEADGREFAERMAAMLFPSEAAARIELVKPHLEAFYGAWEVPELEPYVRQNSRQ
jgi:5-methylthioadenosine/S-adenosylhomocysteine deaminase